MQDKANMTEEARGRLRFEFNERVRNIHTGLEGSLATVK